MYLELEKILQLQNVDIERINLSKKRTKIVNGLKAIGQEIEAKIDQHTQKNKLFKQLEVKSMEVELETKVVKERIEALKGKQNLVKKNQEYQALTHEVKRADTDLQRYKQEAISIVAESQNLKVQISELDLEIETDKKNLFASVAEIKKEISAIEVDLKKTKVARKNLAAKIDPKALFTYERLMKTRAPRAVVSVKNNVCGGCNINLPAQVVGDIMKNDGFVVCESCARILYVEPKKES